MIECYVTEVFVEVPVEVPGWADNFLDLNISQAVKTEVQLPHGMHTRVDRRDANEKSQIFQTSH